MNWHLLLSRTEGENQDSWHPSEAWQSSAHIREINFDESSFTSLGSRCSQAAEGNVDIVEAVSRFIKAIIVHNILLNFLPASIGWKVNVSPPDTDNPKMKSFKTFSTHSHLTYFLYKSFLTK